MARGIMVGHTTPLHAMPRTRNARNFVVASDASQPCHVQEFAFFRNYSRLTLKRGSVIGMGNLDNGQAVTVKGHIEEESAIELRGTLDYLHRHASNVVKAVTIPKVVACGTVGSYRLRNCGIEVDEDVQHFSHAKFPPLHCVVQEYLPGITAKDFLLDQEKCSMVAKGIMSFEFGVTDWEHSTWPIEHLKDTRELPGLHFGNSVYADVEEKDWTIFTTADLMNNDLVTDPRFDPRAFVWMRFLCDVIHTLSANPAVDRLVNQVLGIESDKVPVYYCPLEHGPIASDAVIARAIDELDRAAVVSNMRQKRRRIVVDAQLAVLALMCRSVAAFATACAIDRVFHFDLRLLNCIVKIN